MTQTTAPWLVRWFAAGLILAFLGPVGVALQQHRGIGSAGCRFGFDRVVATAW